MFAYTHPSKNKLQPTLSQPTLPQISYDLQNSMGMVNPFFSNFFQALITPQLLQQQQQQQQSLTSHNFTPSPSPLIHLSMSEFLQQLDKEEEVEDYYIKFLEGFEKQKIKVKHLCKLTDVQFEVCGVTAIGDLETIREAAKKYK